MKTIFLAACFSSLVVLATPSAQAQDLPSAEASLAQDNATETQVAPASGEEWAQFSNNDRTLYLIDLKSFKPVGDATAARVARVSSQGGTSAFAHRIDEYEIKCRQNQARMTVEIEFDDSGTEVERYPEADAEWETMRPTSLPAYFKSIVCDNARPNGTPANSIKSFIERGRQ